MDISALIPLKFKENKINFKYFKISIGSNQENKQHSYSANCKQQAVYLRVSMIVERV